MYNVLLITKGEGGYVTDKRVATFLGKCNDNKIITLDRTCVIPDVDVKVIKNAKEVALFIPRADPYHFRLFNKLIYRAAMINIVTLITKES